MFTLFTLNKNLIKYSKSLNIFALLSFPPRRGSFPPGAGDRSSPYQTCCKFKYTKRFVDKHYKMDHNSPPESKYFQSSQPPPEIAIEWRDVEIEVKVLSADLPPKETQFVRYCVIITRVSIPIICQKTHIIHQIVSDPR